MKRMIIALALLVASAPAFAAEQDKVDICHYDLDYGAWKLISVGANAVEKHFENHDDGLPGSATLGTVTSLDDSCEPNASLLTCPCWSDYTEASLVEYINGWPTEGDCAVRDYHGDSGGYPVLNGSIFSGYDVSTKLHDQMLFALIYGSDQEGVCSIRYDAIQIASFYLDSDEAVICHDEWESVASQVTFCGN